MSLLVSAIFALLSDERCDLRRNAQYMPYRGIAAERTPEEGTRVSLQILIADDHNLLREALRPLLQKLDSEVEVLEASNFDEVVQHATSHRALNLVLLDLNMPGMDGANSVRQLAQQIQTIPIVMMSGQFGRKDVLATIEAGAKGYIPKTLTAAAMVNALQLVLSGETYLPSGCFRRFR